MLKTVPKTKMHIKSTIDINGKNIFAEINIISDNIILINNIKNFYSTTNLLTYLKNPSTPFLIAFASELDKFNPI